jgi:hypothetical protein
MRGENYMKMYTSLRTLKTASKNRSYVGIDKGDMVIVQEKIDGSNFGIWNDCGRIRIFSRRRELSFTDKFCGMPQWCEKKEALLEEIIPRNYALFGEVLGQAKIGYNSKVGKGVERFYAFDLCKITLDEDSDEGLIRSDWQSFVTVQKIAHALGLKSVPVIENEVIFTNEEDFRKRFVENKPSLIDDEFKREGVVLKTVNGQRGVIKIVADAFKESMGQKPNKRGKTPSERGKTPSELSAITVEFITHLTDARIEKFFIKLREDEIFDYQNYENKELGAVFKNIKRLVDDVVDEQKYGDFGAAKSEVFVQTKNYVKKFLGL